METETKTSNRILLILLKEPFAKHTITSLAGKLEITRQGVWKSIDKLIKQKLITVETLNISKTSTAIVKINWSYPLTEKTLSLMMTQESLTYERWVDDFKDLKSQIQFLVLFGSILHSPKTANDIDILAVVEDRSNFKDLDESIRKIQITQLKKIHCIEFTESELKSELGRPNKAYLDALKKGVILYGQDQFIKFIKDVYA